MRTACVIPAKSNSSRLPGKNFIRVGPMSLVEWAILQGTQAGFRPIVVGDKGWPKPEDEKWPRGVFDYVERDEKTSDPEMSSLAVAHWAAEEYDRLILLQPTSPLRTLEDINACLKISESSHLNATTVNDRTGQPNGAVYVRLNKFPLYELGVMYGMPNDRSLDINTKDDLITAWTFVAGKRMAK